MARFVETFKDWIVSFPNRYKIIEDGQEKTVEIERDWEPDVEGTSNNERVMNELVKNITYDTGTVHTTESGTSVYICDLVGMKEFTEYSSSDSSFIPKISAQINTTNSNQLSKIRISGKDGSVSDYDLYTINNGVYSLLGANKLKPNTIVIIKIVSNGANKIAVVQYLMDDKLDKGTYPGKASDLKTEIDTKLDKGTYPGDAGKLKEDIDEKMSKYQTRYDIRDYDDLLVDGFYILYGSSKGIANSPYKDAALVQVWIYEGLVYQRAVSPYDQNVNFVRCFKVGDKNVMWTTSCPYSVGDIYHTTKNEHPAVIWPFTTWEKIEGRFLLGSSGSYALGSIGGSATTTLSEANIPRHRHQVDSTTATIPEHTHTINTGTNDYRRNDGRITWGGTGDFRSSYTTNSAGGGSTGAIAPYTNYVGNGTAFNNMPPYLVVNIWKRLS